MYTKLVTFLEPMDVARIVSDHLQKVLNKDILCECCIDDNNGDQYVGLQLPGRLSFTDARLLADSLPKHDPDELYRATVGWTAADQEESEDCTVPDLPMDLTMAIIHDNFPKPVKSMTLWNGCIAIEHEHNHISVLQAETDGLHDDPELFMDADAMYERFSLITGYKKAQYEDGSYDTAINNGGEEGTIIRLYEQVEVQ